MFSPQEQGSDLASVVGSHPNCLAQWQSGMLLSHSSPAQFHARFWGKSIMDDEQQWRDVQRPVVIGDELEKDQDVDDLMAEDLGEGMDVDRGKDGDEDRSETAAAVDDGDMPGCHILDIGIKGLSYQKIWIRADYIRIYDYVENHYNRILLTPGRAPAAIVTGQPGIGKSVWIYYALRRRLAERKPVIWYWQGACLLYVDEGVYEMPKGFLPGHFMTIVWTLVDSDQAMEGIPNHLVPQDTHHFVIYVTSPRAERWERLHKTTRKTVVLMNPWTKKEMFQAAQTVPPGTIDHIRIDDIYNRLGPTPRLCVKYLTNPDDLLEHEHKVDEIISDVNANKLEKLLESTSPLRMDAISHYICLIRREKREDVHSRAIATPITSYIRTRLMKQVKSLQQAEQIRLYKYFAKVPNSRAVAGMYFEAIAQQCLEEGMILDLVPMVKLEAAQRRENSNSCGDEAKPRWYSSHMCLDNPSLETSRLKALEQKLTIHFRPSDTYVFMENEPLRIIPGVLYIPAAENHAALDSFILLDGYLYIFQFTIGKTHGIKSGLIRFLENCPGVPSMKDWKFIFVIEPRMTLICPQPQLKLRELPLYSAVISF